MAQPLLLTHKIKISGYATIRSIYFPKIWKLVSILLIQKPGKDTAEITLCQANWFTRASSNHCFKITSQGWRENPLCLYKNLASESNTQQRPRT